MGQKHLGRARVNTPKTNSAKGQTAFVCSGAQVGTVYHYA